MKVHVSNSYTLRSYGLTRAKFQEMMTKCNGRPLDSIDWDGIALRYRGGEGLTDLGRSLNIAASTVHGRLKKLGVIFNHKAIA